MNINKEIEILEKELQKVEKFLSNAPLGKVKIKRKKNYPFLTYKFQDSNGKWSKEAYLSIKKPLAKKLLTKQYCETVRPLLISEIAALDAFQKNYQPNRKYEVLSTIPDKMKPLILHPLKDLETLSTEWEQEEYATNSYEFCSEEEFINKKGIRFRSRAEYIIASILDELGLHYRYEWKYSYNGTTLCPDFAIIHPTTGEIFYLEYFGLMDDPNYASNALAKISFYQQTPDAAHFIFVFESEASPLKTEALRQLFSAYFLT